MIVINLQQHTEGESRDFLLSHCWFFPKSSFLHFLRRLNSFPSFEDYPSSRCLHQLHLCFQLPFDCIVGCLYVIGQSGLILIYCLCLNSSLWESQHAGGFLLPELHNDSAICCKCISHCSWEFLMQHLTASSVFCCTFPPDYDQMEHIMWS